MNVANQSLSKEALAYYRRRNLISFRRRRPPFQACFNAKCNRLPAIRRWMVVERRKTNFTNPVKSQMNPCAPPGRFSIQDPFIRRVVHIIFDVAWKILPIKGIFSYKVLPFYTTEIHTNIEALQSCIFEKDQSGCSKWLKKHLDWYFDSARIWDKPLIMIAPEKTIIGSLRASL